MAQRLHNDSRLFREQKTKKGFIYAEKPRKNMSQVNGGFLFRFAFNYP